MATYYKGDALGKKMIELGICPANARRVELHIPADGALELHYQVLVDRDQVGKIAQALAVMAEERKQP
jgi:hypothetical protein